ncbi:MAG: ORF6N domain-containing protein [candidate division FCPU426 bacterium]
MLNEVKISALIHEVQGQRVMLDSDLAVLYGVSTKVLNQAVKRNLQRFPVDFMFRLSLEDAKRLRSQFVTLKRGAHIKYLPYVFTEQGVAMLSGVLKSEKAIEVNIAIMRAFVRLRAVVMANRDFARQLADLEKRIEGHDGKIRDIFAAIRQMMVIEEKPKPKIGFSRKQE